jgi:hypothetical protein
MAKSRAKKETEFCVPIGLNPDIIASRFDTKWPNMRLQPEIVNWCAENLRDKHYFGVYPNFSERPFRVYFENAVDMIHFKMRWF